MKTRALLLALPVLALACRDNGASLQIQAICAMPDTCEWSSKCDRVIAGNPVIDTLVGNQSLSLMLQVENQAPDNSNLGTGRVNTNDAHVDEIVIEYEGVAIPRQNTLTNQWVPAASTELVGVPVVPLNYGTAVGNIVSQALALVRMRGYFDDGSRFETAEFPVAFEKCSNCVPTCGAKTVCGGNDGQLPKSCFDPTALSST